MGVVLEVRVFPLIGAVTPMTVGLNIPAVGISNLWDSIGHCGWRFRPFAAKRRGPRERTTGWLTPDFHGAGEFRGSAVFVSILGRRRRNHRELRFLFLQYRFPQCCS